MQQCSNESVGSQTVSVAMSTCQQLLVVRRYGSRSRSRSSISRSRFVVGNALGKQDKGSGQKIEREQEVTTPLAKMEMVSGHTPCLEVSEDRDS